MKILLIDNDTLHLGKLKNILIDHDIYIKDYYGNYENLPEHDVVVLTGGSELPVKTTPEVFSEEIDLIKRTDKPVIGICEGAQIIAHTFGSTINYLEKKVHGLKSITPSKQNALFKGLTEIKVFESHHWAITKLGRNLEGLTSSKYGYEIIKHRKKFIYGLQFHPEMIEDDSTGHELFIRILSKIF